LDDKIGILFVHEVWFLRPLGEHVVWYLLGQLAEVAPQVGVLCHWASTMVRTWGDDVCFGTILGYDVAAKVMDVAETFGAAWFDDNHDTSIPEALP